MPQCFLVLAALIATVGLATAAIVPGGFEQAKGFPLLENKPPFKVFAMSSLVAMSSLPSINMSIATLTSRHEQAFVIVIYTLFYGPLFLHISMAVIWFPSFQAITSSSKTQSPSLPTSTHSCAYLFCMLHQATTTV